MNKLDAKEELFCIEYLKTMNARQSYLVAYPGVKESTAGVEGCKMLKKPKVKKRLNELMKEREKNSIASAEEVLEFLTAVMRGEITEDVVTSKGSVKYDMKPNVATRLRASNDLAKRYGLLTEKIELEANSKVTIINDIPFEDEEEKVDKYGY